MTERELRQAAEEALEDLRRRARLGEADARRELAELGEVVPPIRHWSERDGEDDP